MSVLVINGVSDAQTKEQKNLVTLNAPQLHLPNSQFTLPDRNKTQHRGLSVCVSPSRHSVCCPAFLFLQILS